jgi:hypothetical protein
MMNYRTFRHTATNLFIVRLEILDFLDIGVHIEFALQAG